jgi:hypothetical protein
MNEFPKSITEGTQWRLGDDATALPVLTIGSRFCVKSRGKYSRCLEGRTGTVIGMAHTKSAVRVIFDGLKCPQTLHRSYLRPIVDAVARVEEADQTEVISDCL